MLALRFSLVAIPAVLALDPRTYALDEEVVPGRYIVTLKDGADSATVDSHVAWAANVHSRLSRRDERGVNKVWRKNFKGYSGEFSNDTIDEILQSDDVVAIEPVTLIAPARAAPASSEQSEIIRQTNATWGLGSISHKSSSTDDPPSDEYLYHKSAGEGMWAYVIDSGIYIEHNDFEGRAHLGYNALADLGVPFEDTNGHGTHCAGTIASKTYGVAKKANLMAVNIFEGASPSSTELIIDGLEWAVQNITRENRQGQSVISMNLSGQKSDALNLAVRNAYLNGILSVVPAGNEGIRADLRSPASELTAITVAASQENNERALFSNWGSKVDLFAAGTNVLSTYIGSPDATYSQSGTSMAAPHVAGLVLYLKAAESGLEGAAAVATRIIELTAKEILKNVPQETFNRLAFNGVEPQLGTGSSEHI